MATHTCSHPLPVGGDGGPAHDDVLPDWTVVVVAAAPAELHRRLSNVLHHQTSGGPRGAFANTHTHTRTHTCTHAHTHTRRHTHRQKHVLDVNMSQITGFSEEHIVNQRMDKR